MEFHVICKSEICHKQSIVREMLSARAREFFEFMIALWSKLFSLSYFYQSVEKFY